MKRTDNVLVSSSNCEIVFSRIFNAPKEVVFRAWTEADHVQNWICPEGLILSDFEINLHPKGNYRFVVEKPYIVSYTMRGVYKEIVFPDKLIYTDGFDLEDGSFLEAIVHLDLQSESGGTRLTMTALYETIEDKNSILDLGVDEATTEMLDRFDNYLMSIR